MKKNRRLHRRKKYFIQRMFQTKFILIFLLLVTLGSLISGLILYTRTNTHLGYEYGKAHIKLEKTGDIIRPALFISYGISIVLVGIATILLTLFISHKVAGPLYRFEKSAEQIGQGNLTLDTKIRGSDQAKGLADAFGRMTEGLRVKLLEIDTHSKDLNGLIEELEGIANQKRPDLEEVRERFEKIAQKSKDLRQSLLYFKL